VELRRLVQREEDTGGMSSFMMRGMSDIIIGEERVKMTVIATLPENTITYMNGIFVYRGNIPESIDGKVSIRNYLLNLRGETQEEKKASFESLKDGMGSGSLFMIFVDDIIELTTTIIQGTISILRSFLYFGMLVGIVGIAIIMFKALYERKRIVGMLKAIGFTKKMVFASFVLETSFIVVIGIVLGIITGTLTSVEIYASPLMQGMALSIPWDQLLGMSLIFYVASLVSTIIPSYIASKIPPAEALRYFE
ncbi:MAG TPA: FtsX-like permease family protein, partial [Mesotoga sp.]|nr:FtsX-like permease family protein [Mesotoga sp.]